MIEWLVDRLFELIDHPLTDRSVDWLIDWFLHADGLIGDWSIDRFKSGWIDGLIEIVMD